MKPEDMVLRICGQNVRVDHIKPGQWASGAMGRSSIKDGIITINPEMRTDIQHSVLIHEVIHFIADSNGLREIIDKEHIIAVLGCHIHSFMRDNKGIIKEILDT